MALNPKQLHIIAKKELKVSSNSCEGFEGCGQGRKTLERCKSDAFCGMPGLGLFHAIKQLYLFSAPCDYVNVNIQISGSFLEITAQARMC